MKAVFSVSGEGGIPAAPHYDIAVQFNGLPGTVVLEITETKYTDGGPGKETNCVVYAPMKASEARAIASAILSAATEAKK